VNFYVLANLNGIANPNLIYVGQVLVIPTAGTGAGGTPPTNGATPGTVVYYYVRVADTLSEIAVDYCTTVAAIANASGITVYGRIYPGQLLYIPVGYCYVNGPVYGYPPHIPPVTTYPPTIPHYGTRYVVRSGDTLYRIGSLFGVNIYRIAEANGILNLNHIYRGQTLIIPSR
jgi:lysozyme